jgi:hypothetical protein
MTNPDLTVGFGRMKPADAEEFAEITLTVENGNVSKAEFACSENETLRMCAETLCGAVTGFPAADLLQMNNNVIYYNAPFELGRDELHLASVCVLAAKRAAADWCRKNGVPFEPGCCNCE